MNILFLKSVKLWQVFLITFVTFQLSLTITGKNIWPFSSHTFFAFNIPEVFENDSLSYYDATGTRIKSDASAFMPVEFFKAHRIAAYVMTSEEISETDKQNFFIRIFEEAKNHPWKRFDETYPAMIIPRSFIPVKVEITLEDKTYNFNKYGVNPLVVEKQPIASLELLRKG